MAAIPDKIFKLETPVSESDSNYEEFEFMLAWYGRDGSFYNYLFTDWEESQDVNSAVLNIEDKDNLTNIIASETREVKVVAEDLTLNDLKILSSIFVAKNIIRVYKDGTFDKIGVRNNSNVYRQTDNRYNLVIDVLQYEKALPK